MSFETDDDDDLDVVVEPGVDSGEVASAGMLRRVEKVAAVYALTAGIALGAASGWRRGLALTLAAAVSIVALRSLEGVVLRLHADAGPSPGLGWRYPLRLLLLAGLVFLLLRGGHDVLAVVLGLSALPLALIAEAGLQLISLARATKNRSR
jgi:hypothetical protein